MLTFSNAAVTAGVSAPASSYRIQSSGANARLGGSEVSKAIDCDNVARMGSSATHTASVTGSPSGSGLKILRKGPEDTTAQGGEPLAEVSP